MKPFCSLTGTGRMKTHGSVEEKGKSLCSLVKKSYLILIFTFKTENENYFGENRLFLSGEFNSL